MFPKIESSQLFMLTGASSDSCLKQTAVHSSQDVRILAEHATRPVTVAKAQGVKRARTAFHQVKSLNPSPPQYNHLTIFPRL